MVPRSSRGGGHLPPAADPRYSVSMAILTLSGDLWFVVAVGAAVALGIYWVNRWYYGLPPAERKIDDLDQHW